jgi:hypothetical protein
MYIPPSISDSEFSRCFNSKAGKKVGAADVALAACQTQKELVSIQRFLGWRGTITAMSEPAV